MLTNLSLIANYHGAPVFPLAPTTGTDRGVRMQTDVDRVDSTAGGSFVLGRDTTRRMEIPLAFAALTRTEVNALEDFFDARKGRRDAFWCPTYRFDFIALDSPPAAPGNLWVREWGWATLVYPLGAAYRNLAITRNGRWMLAPVTAVADTGATDGDGVAIWGYSLGAASLSDILSPGINAGTYATGMLVMRLLFVRFADDALRIEWLNRDLARASVNVVEVAAPEVP